MPQDALRGGWTFSSGKIILNARDARVRNVYGMQGNQNKLLKTGDMVGAFDVQEVF
jgi:hypothetical protein